MTKARELLEGSASVGKVGDSRKIGRDSELMKIVKVDVSTENIGVELWKGSKYFAVRAVDLDEKEVLEIKMFPMANGKQAADYYGKFLKG